MELYPKFKARVAESDDPLMAAVKLAIMGNHSDLLMFENSSDLANHIDKALQANLPQDIWRAFKEKLKKGKTILYFGDNAGEIVLDRILIELIRERYENEVVYVVKKEAALNDSTMKEGLQVGMDQVATLIGNGIDGPLPGTIISRCSREVQRLFKGAEMIISKGGGNYDSLDEEDSNRSNIFFMLLAKCYPYCRVFNTHLFSYVLAT
ncbi:hypothetical protein AAU61_07575 [Desulfocarbo indianensis]|nr:hypothetical protein AAU61_07575 [Desulfocarbo indianensis]